MSGMKKSFAVDRRQFLRISGLLGVGAAVCGAVPVSESVAFDKDLQKVTRTRQFMGANVTVTVVHPSAAKADDAIGSAFAEMERVAGLMNRYDSSSPIGALNADGKVSGLPFEVLDVLAQARRWNEATGGCFDITVAPVVDLYKGHFARTGKPPEGRALAKAMELVGSRMLEVSGSTVRLAKPGMAVTLDGITPGYVADRGAERLKKAGVAHALVNAGGEIRAIGGKDKGLPWTVAVQNPAGGGFMDKIAMADGAVATSGNYEVYFDKEKLFHHIVSPRTGISPRELSSVSVWAKDAVTADALSTAVFVMGLAEGKRFVEKMAGTQALLISREGEKTRTAGWKSA
jgi:thiamine biosynthesis lipoprotein